MFRPLASLELLGMTSMTRYAQPDAVLIADGSARLIIEIEEAGRGFLPVRITGKFMTPALCRYLTTSSQSQPIPFSEDVTFVQVLNTTGLPPGSRKLEQYANVERDIQSLTPFGSISAYTLIAADADAFTFGDAGDRLRKAVSTAVADAA